MDLVGCPVAETLAGPVVEDCGEAISLLLGEFCQAGGFGQILSEQPMGVLIVPALPGVVRRGKVGVDLQSGFNLRLVVELAAVVCNDGSDRVGFLAEQGDGPGLA